MFDRLTSNNLRAFRMSSSDDEIDLSQEELSQEPLNDTSEDEAEVVRELGEQVAKQLIHAYSLKIISKKNDLVERGQRKHWNQIKQRAEQLIRYTFGYDTVEMATETDVMVFLVDRQTLSCNDHLDDESKKMQIFLFLVLGYITLKGPPVTESAVLGFLNKLGIISSESAFGDPKELLTKELPAKFYLTKIKEDNTTTGEKS